MFDKGAKMMLKTCNGKILGSMEMTPSKIDTWLEKNQIAIGVKTEKPIVMICWRQFG